MKVSQRLTWQEFWIIFDEMEKKHHEKVVFNITLTDESNEEITIDRFTI